jgi:peptidoglycan/xylan/chitin deacetylase (PgdA/CDA1 family)
LVLLIIVAAAFGSYIFINNIRHKHLLQSLALQAQNEQNGILYQQKVSNFLKEYNSVSQPMPTPAHDYNIPPIKDGLAPVLTKIDTKEPVVFLGIDDGASKQQLELELMAKNNVKASLFLSPRFMSDNPDFFKGFLDLGSLIENHTYDHAQLTDLSYEQQKKDICDGADYMLQHYGRRPIFMRPSGGAYNTDTQRAAAACGMKAVVNWIAKANGGGMQYQQYGHLMPGDIVLMHFRPEFQQDFDAFLKAQNAAGLHTELLEDWL